MTPSTRLLLLACVGFYPALAGNQVLLRLLNPADGAPQAVAADGAGHLFVLSTLPAAGQQQTRVVKLDLGGTRLASLDIGQVVYPKAAVTDAQGNLIVAGEDSSYQGLVVKVDPLLHSVLFSKSLPASIYAVTVDAPGNVYVTGSTGSTVFPVTAGAYQVYPPVQDPLHGASAVYAFLTEISSDGSKLLYSTYFGDDATYCFGGSSCVGAYAWTIGTAIALDSSGGVLIAGNTDAYDLPTTPGALAGTCACQYKTYAGFIARFQPGAAQQLQWSTFLKAPLKPYDSVAVDALALDAAGDVFVGGSGPATLPATPGSVQPAPLPVLGTVDDAGFLIKLNHTGTAVVWGTFFGGGAFSNVKAIAVDAQGRVLFSGVTLSPNQPSVPAVSPYLSGFVGRLASDGATLADYYPGPFGLVGQGLAIASTGGFAAVGSSGGLWIETTAPGPSLLAVTNGAGGGSLTTLAPYELISLYGVGIGPPAPLTGQVVNGAFTTSLGGYQVLFNGVAAPLLYAGSGQFNAVVPSRVGGGASAGIQIVTPLGTLNGPTAFVAASAPAVFVNPQTGLAAAVNQDGSLNSPSNPARPGSVVAVFATGGGSPYWDDGAIVPIGIYPASQPVWAMTGLLSLEVDFAGAAPGQVAGLMQIDFRVPDSLQPGTILAVSFDIGGVSTNPVQIAVAP
ncbi:MAG TPA: hypothetical protein VKF41_04020 [Bryobacteraceae bacterium]|nr:hypothetical protein [Bryobacteraceae bacterium]